MDVCRKILYFTTSLKIIIILCFYGFSLSMFLVFIHLNFLGFVCWPFFQERERERAWSWVVGEMGLWGGERGDQHIV